MATEEIIACKCRLKMWQNKRKFMQNAHLLRFVQMPIRFGLVKVKKWGMGMDMDTFKVFYFFWTFEVTSPNSLWLYFLSNIFFKSCFLQSSRLPVLTLSVLCLAENFYPFRARPKFLHFSVTSHLVIFWGFFLWSLRRSCSDGFWPVRGCDTYQLCFNSGHIGLFMSAECYCKLGIIVNNYFYFEILYVWE